MRDIKFRAWDKEEGKWYKPMHEAYRGNLFELFVSFKGSLVAHTVSNLEHESLWPEQFILMQYTGVNDKNGQEVYEGDLVIIHREKDGGGNHFKPRAVHWQPHRAGWNVTDMSRKQNRGELQVVGNIYEHSDLLK